MDEELREFILQKVKLTTTREMTEDISFCEDLLTSIFQGQDLRNSPAGKSLGLQVLENEFNRFKQ